MKTRWVWFFCASLTCGSVILSVQEAEARDRKRRTGTVVSPADIGATTFEDKRTVKNKKGKRKKKKIEVSVQCYNGVAGIANQTKAGDTVFKTFAEKIKDEKRKKKKVRKNRKKLQKINKRIKSFRKRIKKGNAACEALGTTREPSEGPAIVDSNQLARFEGTFGAAQAQRLCDRFSFGCTPDQVAQLVALGLDGAVARLQTWNAESKHVTFPNNPPIAALVYDAACDGYIKGEEQDGSNDNAEEECNPRNPNDRDITGVRSRLYLEAFGDNAYFAKCVAFLSDEAEAPTLSFAAGDGRYRHLAEKYLADLWQACISGDYQQYIRDCFIPTEGSGYCSAVLNVIGNRDPQIPNEDGARELLELGTVGYKTLDGRLNYYPKDIAANALAFTGWVWSEITVDAGEDEPVEMLVPSFSSVAFQPGEKVLFADDPAHRASINDMNDSVTAAFAHSETAVELAEKICREFIAKNCSNALVLELSNVVRESNFNLNTIFGRIMKSKIFYSNETKNRLIKHPMELYLGFLKQIGFPVGKEPMSLRDLESKMLERTGQRAFLPPTIFGFYEDELAAEVRVLDRRTAMFNTLDFDPQDIEENIGYSIRQRFMTNLPPASSDSLAVIQKIMQVLNIELSQAQIDAADRFLNYYRDRECSNYEITQGDCTEEQKGQAYDRRDVFDLGSSNWKYVERVQGLLVMMGQSFAYQTK